MVDKRAGQAAVTAIEVATQAALDRKVAGIVTGPINKEAIWAAGSEHLGHTEMLGALTGVTKQDTMFVVRNAAAEGHHLRIFFTTRHVSLRTGARPDHRGAGARSRSSRHTPPSRSSAWRSRGWRSPRSTRTAARTAPSATRRSCTSARPACEAARGDGLDVTGPVPADSVFHQGLVGRFDGVLSHFHDQGHIPAKTFDFDGTISVTVGLPILRTSVDHGTAFDIAGSGKAGHGTMLSAYLAAVDYAPYVEGIRAAYAP